MEFRAIEYSCQRIVVLRWDRIEFVIVATRARDRKSEKASRQCIHAVIKLIGGSLCGIAILIVLSSESEVAEGD